MDQRSPDPRLFQDFDRDALPSEVAERLAEHAIDSDAALRSPDEETLPSEFFAVLAESETEFAEERELKIAQRALLERPEPLDSSWLEATLADSLFSDGPLRDWVLPRRIDAYEIEGRLARGAMGIVYRARHVNLKNVVALKILSPELTDSPRAVAQFYREMEALGQLRHPNIVQALHAGQAEGLHFLAMELVDGIDVSRISAATPQLLISDACEIIRQAAKGLGAAYRRRLVHRDIKPSNLMITRSGRVKLLDLGLASVRFGYASDTHEVLPAGTADYMAPEQWESSSAVDVRADLYSLGCTLFKLLAGRTPFFEERTVQRKMQAHASQPPPSLAALRADVPSGLEAIVLRLIAKSPEDRFTEPRELVEALQPYCEGSSLAALVATVEPRSDAIAPTEETDQPLLMAGPHRMPPHKRRWRWAAAAIGAIVLLAGIVIRINDKGEITITVDQPQATVQIGPHEFETSQAGQPVTVTIQSGEYQLIVTKPGFEAERQSVRIESGAIQSNAVKLARSEEVVRGAPAIDLASGPLTAVRLVAAGDRAVVGGADGRIRVVQLASRKELSSWPAHAAHDSEAMALDVDPTGARVVSGGRDGAIVVWDLASGAEVRRLLDKGPPVLFVKISTDGKRLIAGGMAENAELWDLETYERIATLRGHQTWVRDAAFDPENRFAVTCGNDTNVLVWDLTTHRMTAFLVGHSAPVSSVDLTADGRFAVTGSWDGTVRIWDLRTGTNVRTMTRHSAPVRQVRFLDDASVISASEDHDLRVWNPARDESSLVFRGHTREVVDADARPTAGPIVSGSDDGTLRLWTMPTGRATGDIEGLAQFVARERVRPLDEPLAAWKIGDEPLTGLAVSRGGSQFGVVSRSGKLSIWDTAPVEVEDGAVPSSRRITPREVDPPGGVTSLAYGPDGNLAIGSRDGNVYLLADGDRTPRQVYAHENWVSGVALTADGGSMATSGLDGRVRLWDIGDDREVAVHTAGEYWMHAVAVHGGNPTTLYAGGTDGSVYAWHAGQARPPAQYGEPFTWHAVLTLAVSDDNRYVAAGGVKGDIRIWDNVEAALARSLSNSASGQRVDAPASPICDIAFTPDAAHLASASEDGAIRLWDWSTGRALRVVQAHDGAARAVAIVDDSVFSAGDDGLVRMWRLTSME